MQLIYQHLCCKISNLLRISTTSIKDTILERIVCLWDVQVAEMLGTNFGCFESLFLCTTCRCQHGARRNVRLVQVESCMLAATQLCPCFCEMLFLWLALSNFQAFPNLWVILDSDHHPEYKVPTKKRKTGVDKQQFLFLIILAWVIVWDFFLPIIKYIYVGSFLICLEFL